jgi:hypothetical protein
VKVKTHFTKKEQKKTKKSASQLENESKNESTKKEKQGICRHKSTVKFMDDRRVQRNPLNLQKFFSLSSLVTAQKPESISEVLPNPSLNDVVWNNSSDSFGL